MVYYLLNESNINAPLDLSKVKSIAAKIAAKTKADEKKPVGNQNCLICTMCMEANLKGIKILPRPVYSPRDIIFKHDATPIVLNPSKTTIKNRDHIKSILHKAGNYSRYYCHVNWKDSMGGHEFLLINIDDTVYVVDAQANLVGPIDDKVTGRYFDKINWDNSFVYRVDNKQMNPKVLEYNNMKYCLPWDEEKDRKYLEDQE